MTGYQPPLDTYSDMSQLNPAEDWPQPAPLSVAYFCGVMGDDAAPNDTKLATEKARQDSLAWMTSRLGALWTGAGQGAASSGICSMRRTPPWARRGSTSNFGGQYLPKRALCAEPAEYAPIQDGVRANPAMAICSSPAMDQTPDVNVGAVEVACMSGLAAASALSGVEIPIVCGTWLYGPPAAVAEVTARAVRRAVGTSIRAEL